MYIERGECMTQSKRFKLGVIMLLPLLLQYVMSVLYGFCIVIIMDIFSLAHYDPLAFDANDLSRYYFAALAVCTLLLESFFAFRYIKQKTVRAIIIAASAVIIFCFSSLFCQGMMFK